MCRTATPLSPVCNMEDFRKRLTRSLSGPRRCTLCQKMVYFSLVKCKECGDVTHKHCIHHVNHAAVNKDASIVCNPADATHWCSKDHNESAKNRSMSDSSYDLDDCRQESQHSANVAMTGFLRIVKWLSHRKKTKELNCKNNATAIEKHVKGKFGLNPRFEDKETRRKLKALLKNTQGCQRHVNSHSQQKPFQKTRCASARSASTTTTSNRCQRRLCRSFAIRTNDSNTASPHSSISSCNDLSSPFGTPKTGRSDREHRSTNASQPPSQMPKNNDTSTTNADPKPILLPECSGWTFGTDCGFGDTNIGNPSNHDSCQTTNFRFGKRPFGKAKTLSLETHDCNNGSLCATWPPVGKAGTIIEECSDDEIDENIEETTSRTFSSECSPGQETLREWCIPFRDIEFHERIKNGRLGDIFKGRWYGEVLIYTMRQSSGEELRQFLEDVTQMGMIRHENIVLFMGACIEPPKLAVITSMRKGPTLYEYLHLKHNKMPFHSKLNIARQSAQGMGYLHAKGITHRKLNSKNILLESRVKLCMMDYGMTDKKLDRSNCGCISRGNLSYLSPELMRSLRIDPPKIHPTIPHAQQSDIFAFGSLLYELLAERFAFHDQHPHAIIWKVSTGKRASLENFRFIAGLKSLIRRCWSQNPNNRPAFSEIVNVLQQNVSHHKRHSSSVPDKLQYAGHAHRRNICT